MTVVTLATLVDLGDVVAEIPSPTTGVWWIGPLPVRGYALSILAGIIVAAWIAHRRLVARGGTPGQVLDISAWAVPFGIVGGRIYHVITTPQPYFGEGGNPWNAVRIWEGGLGIWGAVALGCLGAWIAHRRLVAQAMGRLGNWFNNEIYGPPTDLPWGLQIYQWDQQAGHAVLDSAGNPILKGVFHPTFLYELLWCLLVAGLLIALERRRSFRPGQVFAAFVVVGYPLGRFFIELIRTDDANRILGLRVNTWVSLLVLALGVFLYRRAGRGETAPGAASVQASAALPDPDAEPASRHAE